MALPHPNAQQTRRADRYRLHAIHDEQTQQAGAVTVA